MGGTKEGLDYVGMICTRSMAWFVKCEYDWDL